MIFSLLLALPVLLLLLSPPPPTSLLLSSCRCSFPCWRRCSCSYSSC
jgi:hypothetical protein